MPKLWARSTISSSAFPCLRCASLTVPPASSTVLSCSSSSRCAWCWSSAGSLRFEPERSAKLSDVNDVQLRVGAVGQVGSGGCGQLGLPGAVGGQKDLGGEYTHWANLLALRPFLGHHDATGRGSALASESIHPSARKVNSPKLTFRFTEFSDVHLEGCARRDKLQAPRSATKKVTSRSRSQATTAARPTSTSTATSTSSPR